MRDALHESYRQLATSRAAIAHTLVEAELISGADLRSLTGIFETIFDQKHAAIRDTIMQSNTPDGARLRADIDLEKQLNEFFDSYAAAGDDNDNDATQVA